jgi:hypothetical protein
MYIVVLVKKYQVIGPGLVMRKKWGREWGAEFKDIEK